MNVACTYTYMWRFAKVPHFEGQSFEVTDKQNFKIDNFDNRVNFNRKNPPICIFKGQMDLRDFW